MNPNQVFEDFDRKYQSSYVQVIFKPDDKPALFQLRRLIHDSNKFPKLELTSDTHGSVLLNYNTAARILFKVPSNTYIQSGKRTLYFARRAERQWKRGINNNNCGFWNPTEERFLHNEDPFTFKNIREAFQPTFTSLKDALCMLNDKGYSGVALSRNMAVVNVRAKQYGLFYRYQMIGLVDKQGNITSPNFEQEVRNEIK